MGWLHIYTVTPSWPHGKDLKIGSYLFLEFDPKFGFRSIRLAYMTLNFYSTRTK
jgi:hypothetical protein